jgi:hypothetical protein
MSGKQKLVRARPKAIEDMPDWAKCCDEYIAATQKIGEITVDLSTLHDEFFNGCGFCFARYSGARKRAMDVADGLYVSLETFDLDEGEMQQLMEVTAK